MADELYDLPQVISLALQTQRGELLKALGPTHADELLKAMDRERLIQIMNLIADLISDRHKLRCQLQVYKDAANRIEDRATALADEFQQVRIDLQDV